MKKRIILPLICLLSCSDVTKNEDPEPEVPTKPEVPTATVLYDFDETSSGVTGFTSYTDVDGNGASTISFAPKQDGENWIGEFTYSLDKAAYVWDPFVNLEVKPGDGAPYDASEYEGISYAYRGDAHTFLFEIEEVTDYAHFRVEVPYSAAWDTVEIHFERDLKQADWGAAVPFTAENMLALSWRVTGATGDNGTVQFDDVKLLETVERELQYDMEIKDPEIPSLITITPGAVTNPNQAKVDRYLTKGINLNNWLEENRPFEGFEVDAAKIAKLASQGFKGIRLPIDLDKWVKNKAEVIAGTELFALDPQIFTVLDSLLLWTEQNGLSITIDYHQYDGSLNKTSVSDPGYRAMAANCWKAVAAHYADNPREDIFYELTNEPGITDDVPNGEWRVMAKEILDSIRSVDSDRSVIYGESRWYGIDVLTENPLFAPTDPNVIYAFHFYEPFIFTHQAASWGEMGSTGNVPFPYSKEKWSTEFSDFGVNDATPAWVKTNFLEYYKEGNKNAMMNQVIPVRNWAIENNVAVVCNEFGAYKLRADQESLRNYFVAAAEIFEALDIGWAIWFGIHDDNGDLIPGVAGPMGFNE